MYVEKLTDQQLKELISPKFYDTLTNLSRHKWNGRLYVNYTCCNVRCLTVFEDFQIVYSGFPIEQENYRKFMMSQFKDSGYLENFSNFIKQLKIQEYKDEINELKNI